MPNFLVVRVVDSKFSDTWFVPCDCGRFINGCYLRDKEANAVAQT